MLKLNVGIFIILLKYWMLKYIHLSIILKRSLGKTWKFWWSFSKWYFAEVTWLVCLRCITSIIVKRRVKLLTCCRPSINLLKLNCKQIINFKLLVLNCNQTFIITSHYLNSKFNYNLNLNCTTNFALISQFTDFLYVNNFVISCKIN